MLNTIKAFAQQTNIDESLIRAVVRQFGGWKDFQESAQDVARYGANAGYSGFTYYTDTVRFTQKNKQSILELARQQAQDYLGVSVYEFIAGFNCIDLDSFEVADALHEKNNPERDTVYNALAWYALEEVAREYDRIVDDN